MSRELTATLDRFLTRSFSKHDPICAFGMQDNNSIILISWPALEYALGGPATTAAMSNQKRKKLFEDLARNIDRLELSAAERKSIMLSIPHIDPSKANIFAAYTEDFANLLHRRRLHLQQSRPQDLPDEMPHQEGKKSGRKSSKKAAPKQMKFIDNDDEASVMFPLKGREFQALELSRRRYLGMPASRDYLNRIEVRRAIAILRRRFGDTNADHHAMLHYHLGQDFADMLDQPLQSFEHLLPNHPIAGCRDINTLLGNLQIADEEDQPEEDPSEETESDTEEKKQQKRKRARSNDASRRNTRSSNPTPKSRQTKRAVKR